MNEASVKQKSMRLKARVIDVSFMYYVLMNDLKYIFPHEYPTKLNPELNEYFSIHFRFKPRPCIIILRQIQRGYRHRTIHFYSLCSLFFRTKIIFTKKS